LDVFVVPISQLPLDLLERWWVFAKESIAGYEEIALRVVGMPLDGVEKVETEHLVVLEPAIVVAQQMLRPLFYWYRASFGVVQVSNSAREEPRKGVGEYLLRQIIFSVREGRCSMMGLD
jgi:hypothetical protein